MDWQSHDLTPRGGPFDGAGDAVGEHPMPTATTTAMTTDRRMRPADRPRRRCQIQPILVVMRAEPNLVRVPRGRAQPDRPAVRPL